MDFEGNCDNIYIGNSPNKFIKVISFFEITFFDTILFIRLIVSELFPNFYSIWEADNLDLVLVNALL